MKTSTINWAGHKALFWSLCLLLSIPFFALCIQSRYLAGLEEGGSTIGTWLGLFLILNQVAQAFVLTPLYHLFGEVADDRQRLYSRVKDGFFIALIAGTILYAIGYQIISSFISFAGGSEEYAISALFLRLNILSLILGFGVNYAVVALSILGKARYIAQIASIRAVLTIAGNLILLPLMGITGAPYAGTISNLVLVGLCISHLHRWDFDGVSTEPNLGWMLSWAGNGLFSGMQAVLGNAIFCCIFAKAAGNIGLQGPFLIVIAVSFGLLAVPSRAYRLTIQAQTERPARTTMSHRDILEITAHLLIFLALLPTWKTLVQFLFGIPAEMAANTVVIFPVVIPFVFVYAANAILQSAFIVDGNTVLCMVAAMCAGICCCISMFALWDMTLFQQYPAFLWSLFGIVICIETLASTCLYIQCSRWTSDSPTTTIANTERPEQVAKRGPSEEQIVNYMAGALLLPLEPVYEFLEEKQFRTAAPKERIQIVDTLCKTYNVDRVLAFRRIREVYTIMDS